MSVFIAFVLLKNSPNLIAQDIVADAQQRWPESKATVDESDDASLCSFKINGDNVFIAAINQPIPWQDLEGPCATSVLWENAEEAVRAHTEHLIVTVFSEQSSDPVTLARVLTQASASILAVLPEAIGVYWGGSTLVIPKALFIDMATGILPEIPVYLWVDVRVGDGLGFTQGMQAFDHKEIEVTGATESFGAIRERLYNLCIYLLENGAVIKDGDTVGGDEHEKIKIKFGPSQWDAQREVMHLIYEPEVKKKSWWKRG